MTVTVGASGSGSDVLGKNVAGSIMPSSPPGVAVINVGVTSNVGGMAVTVLVAVGCGTGVHVGSGDGVRAAFCVDKMMASWVTVAAMSGVIVAVALAVAVGTSVDACNVAVGVVVDVGRSVGVSVARMSAVAVGSSVSVGVIVGVLVRVAVAVWVGVCVPVAVGWGLLVADAVAVCVGAVVDVAEGGTSVGVDVSVKTMIGVRVGSCAICVCSGGGVLVGANVGVTCGTPVLQAANNTANKIQLSHLICT